MGVPSTRACSLDHDTVPAGAFWVGEIKDMEVLSGESSWSNTSLPSSIIREGKCQMAALGAIFES